MEPFWKAKVLILGCWDVIPSQITAKRGSEADGRGRVSVVGFRAPGASAVLSVMLIVRECVWSLKDGESKVSTLLGP